MVPSLSLLPEGEAPSALDLLPSSPPAEDSRLPRRIACRPAARGGEVLLSVGGLSGFLLVTSHRPPDHMSASSVSLCHSCSPSAACTQTAKRQGDQTRRPELLPQSRLHTGRVDQDSGKETRAAPLGSSAI